MAHLTLPSVWKVRKRCQELFSDYLSPEKFVISFWLNSGRELSETGHHAPRHPGINPGVRLTGLTEKHQRISVAIIVILT
jgi:hypothetical protein